MVKSDGTAAICARVPDGCAKRKDGTPIVAKRDQGWLHELKDQRSHMATRPRMARAAHKPKVVRNWSLLSAEFEQAMTDDMCDKFACEHGLSSDCLRRLGFGWCASHNVYTFPMRDDKWEVVGIRTRGLSGGKWCIRDSTPGLFIPLNDDGRYEFFDPKGPLCIAEGPTESAAVLSMGFDVIGRPNCSGGVEFIAPIVRELRRDVWILANNDKPDKLGRVAGWSGAVRLAEHIHTDAHPVKIIMPPKHKDFRAWLMAGANRKLVEALARTRKYWQQKSHAA